MPPLESSPFPVAEVAEVYPRRRRHLLDRLARVERELRRCDSWETNRLRPEALQRPAARSAVPREILDSVQRMLTEELVRLDGGLR